MINDKDETMRLIIRAAGSRDVDSIAEIEETCIPEPWSKETLRKDIEGNDRARYILALADGKPVGFASCWIIGDEADINNVAVMPDYRNLKVGSVMLYALIGMTENEGVKSHTLEVRASNEAALALYEKQGFREAGVRKGYYQDNGEDAVIMWRLGELKESDLDMMS